MKNVVVLGSTGAIGANALEVIRQNRRAFSVLGLAAKSNKKLLRAQIGEFSPRLVCIDEEDESLARDFPAVEFLSGGEGLCALAAEPAADIVLAAVPGILLLQPALEAFRRGKTVALATKEIMVVAGDMVMETCRKHGGRLLPVDSEHNAIFQIIEKEKPEEVARIYLTASGGPFLRRKSVEDVTSEDVLAHPVWKMGRKITVDSATLMNKGFEMIEAHHLFSLPSEKIEVLIHPEAVVHGLVEMTDGVVKAVLSPPDMKFALSHVLHYPERGANKWEHLRLSRIGKLTFEKPDEGDAWISLARRALREKGSFPAVLNGANEEAVDLFLSGRLRFARILPAVEEVLARHRVTKEVSVEDIIEVDRWAHEEMRKVCT